MTDFRRTAVVTGGTAGIGEAIAVALATRGARVTVGGRNAEAGAEVVLLSPGTYNSAYFEHSYLARRIGCELVQGSDLFVEDKLFEARDTLTVEPLTSARQVLATLYSAWKEIEVDGPTSG